MVISFEGSGGDLNLQGDTGWEEVTHFLDEDLTLYRYFGMHKAGFWDLWGRRALWAYIRLIGRGKKMMKSSGDIYQRGGDVLLDPVNVVRFQRVANGPGDRPDPETLFRLVEEQS